MKNIFRTTEIQNKTDYPNRKTGAPVVLLGGFYRTGFIFDRDLTKNIPFLFIKKAVFVSNFYLESLKKVKQSILFRFYSKNRILGYIESFL